MAIDSSMQTSSDEATVTLREPDEDTEDQDTSDDEPAAAAGATESTDKTPGQGRPAPGKPTNGKMSRKERRQGFQTAQQQAEARLQESLDRRFTEYQGRFEQMIARAMQQQAPRQQQAAPQGSDEMERLEMALQAEIAAAQNHDRTKGNYDYSRYNKIQREIQRLGTERAVEARLRQMGLTPDALRRVNQPNDGMDAVRQQYNARFYQLATEFPWITDGKMAKSVGAYRNYLLAEGKPDSIDTDREAAAYIAAQRGIRGRVPPRGNPAPYAGIRGGNGGGEAAPREMRLPKGALNGLSPDEVKHVTSAVFSSDT